MRLVRLIYTSKISSKMTSGEIESLLKTAQRNNRRDRITGYLCFSAGNFLQVLEGDAAAVSKTFLRIAQDSRHTEITLLEYIPVSERQFGEWSMGYVGDSRINRQFCLKYSTSDHFDPLICPENALQIILALAEEQNKKQLTA